MLVPRGELFKEDVKPEEVLMYLDKRLRGKKLKIKHGYLDGSITSVYGHFQFKIVFRDKKIVSAEVIKTNTKRKWSGYEAIKVISCLLFLSTKTPNIITNIKLYKLDKKLLQLAEKILNVEDITDIIDDAEKVIKELTRENGRIYENTSIERVLNNLSDGFTGTITGETESGNYYAKVYVKKGRVVGAFVRMDGQEIKGTEATYYLDEECKIIRVHETFTIVVPEAFEVKEEEINVEDVKLDDKLNELLESLKNRRN